MSSNSMTENVTILVLVHLKIETKGDISGVALNMTGRFFTSFRITTDIILRTTVF